MKSVQSYLTLPDFRPRLMSLRWSNVDCSLEYNNRTFLFAEEIAEFLEGFAPVRRIIHFTFIVRLLLMVREAPDEAEPTDSEGRRLWELFKSTGGSLRCAGAFCARLCHDIPAAREANHVTEICRRLRARVPLSIHLADPTKEDANFIRIVACGYDPPEIPPFDTLAFEAKVTKVFRSFSDEEAAHWFKHGRGPLAASAAKALAQAVPPTLAGRLASVLTRPRLTRARAWVAQLLSALSLPPRRLVNQDLPLGGYADVTTHGQVDQILPSQFALDEWDFFRRFAERELLYFRREDPREQSRQELLAILDQGVRTWGEIRLVLGAALLALGKQTLLRGCPFLLATSSVDTINPLQVEEESLGEMIEASDLSAHPGLALERVLEQPSRNDRDVILLTHPRNLDEEDVRAAAKRLRPGTRLFALTLDRHGHAELTEFKHGIPVAIRQFRVDYSAAPAEAAPAPLPDKGPWNGDVEPIGYPFRFGVGGRIAAGSFDFDVAGNFLLAAGPHGTLYLSEVGGKLVEILPRPMWQGNVLNGATPHVMGVAGGFVVAGPFGSRALAAHVDLVNRKCTCHPLNEPPTWCGNLQNLQYAPAHHCLIVHHAKGGLAIDLSTGERFATNLGGNKSRAQDAWIAWERGEIPARQIPVTHMSDPSRRAPSVWVAPDTGTVILEAHIARTDPLSGREHQAWEFAPQADGRPMLRHQSILTAQLGGENLALHTSPPGEHQATRLHLMRVPEGVPLGEYPMGSKNLAFRLSANGALLARQLSDAMIEISQVTGNLTNLSRTNVGGFVDQLPFVLGKDRLMMLPGRHAFLLDWSRGKLESTYYSRGSAPEVKHGVGATPKALPEPCRYDRKRWLMGACNTLLAGSDRYGQLAVFDRRQNLVCMFFAFRTRVAGWMPDGTCFRQITTADEATVTHFGRALQAAAGDG